MLFEKYSEDDYEAVCDFQIELNRADRSHINWNWARFEWMYEHPDEIKELQKQGFLRKAWICEEVSLHIL